MFYLFDGTKEGFLTAFVEAFADSQAQLLSPDCQLVIGETKKVETDLKKAEKAEKRLSSFDCSFPYQLDRLLRSGEEKGIETAFRYTRYLAQEKTVVKNRLAVPEVFAAMQLIKKINFEIHRLHGFVRFMECQNGVLYAPITPDNDICDLLLPHFRSRFPQLPFLLHDIKRKKAAVYDGKGCYLLPLEKADILLSDNESDLQALFQRYYQAVNIPSRERIKQMKGYMPVRYWKFLPELHNPFID